MPEVGWHRYILASTRHGRLFHRPKKHIMKTLLLALGLLSSFTSARADEAAQLTQTLAALQQHSSLPGFAVAVVTPDGAIYEHGFGLADLARKTPYTAHTLQNLGSVSKTVVGVALVKGIELGYFQFDTDIDTSRTTRPAA